jgi:hypothetical protein
VIDIQFGEGHLAAFAGVTGVVLHVNPGLEVQRIIPPRRALKTRPLLPSGVLTWSEVISSE